MRVQTNLKKLLQVSNEIKLEHKPFFSKERFFFEKTMHFENYIGIDWSGDKNNFQKGISVSLCKNGDDAPTIIKPPEKYWTRYNLIDWLNKILAKEKSLVGFDFAFSYPFYDYFSYFPGIKDSPTNVKSLWSIIDIINQEKENLNGGKL